jgi:hypothetical protein
VQGLVSEVSAALAFVEAAVAARAAVPEVERERWRRVLRLGQEVLRRFCIRSGTGAVGEPLSGPAGQGWKRLAQPHPRIYQAVVGAFELQRIVYGTRAGPAIAAAPLEERLRLPESPGSCWRKAMDPVGGGAPARCARRPCRMAQILDWTPAVHRRERVQRHWAQDGVPCWEQAPPAPPAPAAAMVVARAGGQGAPLRGVPPVPPVERRHACPGPPPGGQADRLGGYGLPGGALHPNARSGAGGAVRDPHRRGLPPPARSPSPCVPGYSGIPRAAPSPPGTPSSGGWRGQSSAAIPRGASPP